MKKQPKIGFHKITVHGQVVDIFVMAQVRGNTTAVLIQFRKREQVRFFPKSRLPYCHLLQFYEDVKTWGVADMLNPLLLHPISKVSWE